MTNSKTVLFLDLKKKSYEVKVFADYYEFIGGIGLALRLLEDTKDSNPIIFSVGPLNSSFPFVSKICCLFYDISSQLVESYGGGMSGLVTSLTPFDAVVIREKSLDPVIVNIISNKVEFLSPKDFEWNTLGLAGRRAQMLFSKYEVLLDNYFHLDPRLGAKMVDANLYSLVISSDMSITVENIDGYKKLYSNILSRGRELSVPYSTFLSCAGCPAGCSLSSQPEFSPDLTLSYCLVACGYSRAIFEDVPTVFSCLNSLGMNYQHEILEEISIKIREMRTLYAKI